MTFIHIKDNTSKLLKQNIKHNTKLGLHGFIGIHKTRLENPDCICISEHSSWS